MRVNRRFFPEIPLDNDEVYLGNLTGVIEAVDEYASLEVTRSPNQIHFRLAPSMPKYSEMLLQEILKFNNMFHIHLDLSKSIKACGVINFAIQTNN